MKKMCAVWIAVMAAASWAQDGAPVENEMRREALQMAQAIEKQGAWDDVLFVAGFAGTAEARTYLDGLAPKAPRSTCEGAIRAFGRKHAGQIRDLARREMDKAEAARLAAVADVLADIQDHHAALRRINAVRRSCALPPVEYDLSIAVGVQLHCRYLDKHPDDGHDESDRHPEYTPEGARAAKNSVLARGRGMVASIDDWMATFYHRIDFLSPGLKRVGTGQVRSGPISACDTSSARGFAEPRVVEYPPRDAVAVPLAFSGNERPNPIPSDPDGQAGFPVTLSFFGTTARPEKVKARLVEAGKGEIECWFSSPERPARDDFSNLETVCLMAKAPLRGGRTYQVTIEYTLNGERKKTEWSFSTSTKARR